MAGIMKKPKNCGAVHLSNGPTHFSAAATICACWRSGYLATMSAELSNDISNWTVEGEVRYTFRPGVVIPTGGTLHVARDVVAFRQRATSPRGNEGRFVQGGYRGQVTKNEGALRLYDDQGRKDRPP